MELFCPNCQRKLTIPDQYAGQLMKCPLCTNTFTAPALAPPPAAPVVSAPPLSPVPVVAPPPPPQMEPAPFSFAPPAPEVDSPQAPAGPPVEDFGMATAEPPAPFFGLEPSSLPAPPPALARPAPPPPPPGDYTRSWTLVLSQQLVPWITPLCLTLLFFLSFTVWYGTDKRLLGTIDSPWYWAWVPQAEAPTVPTLAFKLFLMFTVILAWPLSLISLLLELQVLALPAGLRGLRPLRPLLVGIPTLLGFLALAWVYLPATFHVFKDFGTLGLRMAVFLHIWALLGLGLEQWLEKRRQRNLPPPRIELRW